jgi:anionic cell wall polymer biosynthesis LytR-Cps2A-Psr (LCP) family protein
VPDLTQPRPLLPGEMPMVIAPRLTRRQARAERRRQRNRRFGVAGIAGIVVVVLIVAAALAFGGHKLVTGGKKASDTQTTVLFQIQGPNRVAIGSALLAADPATKQGVEVLVPTSLITDVCGVGTAGFGSLLGLPGGATKSQQALTSLLNGVTVDGSWVVSTTQLASLVNLLHGVRVDVDTNVVKRNPDGSGTVLVQAGTQKLNGTQAAEYATYGTSGGGAATVALTRLQRVIDAIAQALPTGPDAIAPLIRQLGSGAGSSLGATKLASFLADYAAAYRTQGGVYRTDIPITQIDAGGAPSYAVDNSPTGVPQLVKSYLAKSVPAGAGASKPTVLLLNGTFTPGVVPSACPRLVANGFQYAGGGNAAQLQPNAPSTVIIRSDSNNDVTLGDNVAKALGLSSNDVEVSRNDQQVADVIVTLGSDYHK